MKMSLKTKVAVLIALIIMLISTVSTYLFTSAQSRSTEREIIARGFALSYSLAKAAEAGLTAEDLDLINKASHVVRAEDVSLAQVYSSIWTVVDAYPFARMKEPPLPEAVAHFNISVASFYKKNDGWYDFYSPIIFKPYEKAEPVNIGYARLKLSSAVMDRTIRKAIITNVLVSVTITLLAIIAMNYLIGRLVIGPVLKLHGSVAMFKKGMLPDVVPVSSYDELGELALEFNKMSRALKEREAMLVESGKRIRNLFERVEHAIFRMDDSGNIVETNKKFDELCGTIKKFCSLFSGSHGSVDWSGLCLQKAVSGKLINVEDMIMAADGGELKVMLSLYPEVDGDGNLKGFDGYFIDITEKKRIEEALVHSEKLKSIGVLAGGIAHEFNNLLTGILGYSSLLEEMSLESDKARKYVETIKRSADIAAGLTRQLLGFARKGKYVTEKLNINEMLAEQVSFLKDTFDRNIVIVFEAEQGLPSVEGDMGQLYQLFMNLFLNAKDAMPEGGRLYIKTEFCRLHGEKIVEFFQIPAGEYVRISVTDTGVGMPPEVKKRIFEPFYTTKEVGKGTGLGLSMVYGVVKNHNGHISVYSEPGIGTTVRMYFPGAEGGIHESAVFAEPEAKRNNGTILVIDDEEMVRELGKEILEAYGYRVLLANNGDEGVKAFRDRRDSIDVVIVDLIMPEKGGKQAFREIREIRPDIKVIVCTGHADERSFADMFIDNGVEFLPKPFQSAELLGKVGNLIRV